MRENTDQNNSEYGHFLRIDHIFLEQIIFMKHESITFFDKNFDIHPPITEVL